MSYPEKLRLALTPSKLLGIPFDSAWAKAVREHPAPLDWGGDGRGRGKRGSCPSALEFARGMFEAAYLNQAVPGPDMSSLPELVREAEGPPSMGRMLTLAYGEGYAPILPVESIAQGEAVA